MNIKELYDYIVELRNRLSNDISNGSNLQGTGMVFEEDHIMLDYVLDLLENQSDYKTKEGLENA